MPQMMPYLWFLSFLFLFFMFLFMEIFQLGFLNFKKKFFVNKIMIKFFKKL